MALGEEQFLNDYSQILEDDIPDDEKVPKSTKSCTYKKGTDSRQAPKSG